jgi:cystathionine beta-lyase/cystathionine gamma-synthase
MSGFGGVISFEVRGSLESASKFIDALRIPYIAPSLGGVETLVEQPTIVSYWDKTPGSALRSASATTWCAIRAASRTRDLIRISTKPCLI